MEPNESLVKGKFLRNVLFRALPAAMTDLTMVVGILLFYIAFHLDDTSMITICTGVMGIVGLMMVHRTCQPYNTIRKVMIVVLGVLFVIAYFGFPTLFSLQKLNLQSALILIVFGLLSWPVMKVFCRLNDRMRARFEAWRAAKTAKAAERPHSRRKTPHSRRKKNPVVHLWDARRGFLTSRTQAISYLPMLDRQPSGCRVS